MNLFHLLNGIRLPVLLRLIKRNGISLNPILIIKLVILFINSIISSFLTIAERKKYAKVVEDMIIDKPPVFIIGHWRTGST
jgi:branched-subunit amino acid permease